MAEEGQAVNLYVTADVIGLQTGGGTVTGQELDAFMGVGDCWCWDWTSLVKLDVQHDRLEEPWKWDLIAATNADRWVNPRLAHFYAGTFEHTIACLKQRGCKVTYTAAAHDVEASRREHEKLGLAYDYPHLTDPELLRRYLAGYLAADVLFCPSRHSADVMRGFGFGGRIEVIPHGCVPPDRVEPLPARFTVGYLGAYGPDKGVRYLLEAWRKLDYRDAALLLGGRDSTSAFVHHLVGQFGGGNVQLVGWVDDVSDFYNRCSLYVQPSVTEGFGIEVLEAMAHGRPVVCSKGAGSADLVEHGANGFLVKAGDAEALAEAIHDAYLTYDTGLPKRVSEYARYVTAENHTWNKIRAQYQEVWKELIG